MTYEEVYIITIQSFLLLIMLLFFFKRASGIFPPAMKLVKSFSLIDVKNNRCLATIRKVLRISGWETHEKNSKERFWSKFKNCSSKIMVARQRRCYLVRFWMITFHPCLWETQNDVIIEKLFTIDRYRNWETGPWSYLL